ncbi:MAG TPA: HesA/MoeB/ThiF family protein [Spirochaetota bacterium]|mgnify:CR=1 FL=1|nr:HesA/MoeB/ThiF family protein [Spirochaetota bacterium]HPG51138.1 HesA/MoeB/ThiF family protein [Spirochaetota bacterium]HPN11592.1 HesA/MoeB/ThiF family protein [Spirochaetota bacterium]
MNTGDEQGFYSRQLGLPGWGTDTQNKLKASTVFIAGAGGLGSPVLFYLAAAGVGTLLVCDSDDVDLTNLNRQILHSFNSIGSNKVESARKTILGLNPFVNFFPVKTRITSSNAERLVGESDIIIDCLDNFKARRVLNNVSVNKNIPMVHAGVSEMRGQITFLHPPETPCLSCFLPMNDTKKKNNIVGATAGVMGSLQALEAIKYLTGIGQPLKNRLLFWDGVSMNFETIGIRKNPRCRICRNAV